MKKDDSQKLYASESLMMNVTEDILVAMEDKNVSKTGLATLLDKSKSFVTQMLGGSRNMTLRTLSDIAFALDMEISISFIPKKEMSFNHTCSEWSENKVIKINFSDHRVITTNKEITDSKDWHKAA